MRTACATYVSGAPAGDLKVTRVVPAGLREGFFYRLDLGLSCMQVRPFSKNIDNAISGIKERIMFLDANGTRRPECTRSVSACLPIVRRIVSCMSAPTRLSRKQFIASRPGCKRRLYEAANTQLGDKPSSLAAYARTSLFTKWERSVHMPGKVTVPRIINPRSPQFNILLGRFLTPIEHDVFDALATAVNSPHPVIAKGLTQEQKAAIIVDYVHSGYAAVGLDASRYDQSLGKVLLSVEHLVYTLAYNGDRALIQLLKHQLDNVGVHLSDEGRLFIRYGAIRCSGDMNTSLGNCIISIVMAALYCQENQISDFRLLCDGDDLILFVKRQSLDVLDKTLSPWYLRWGLRMKVEAPAFVPEHVEFCQARPVLCNGRYTLIRNPVKCLNVDFSGFVELGSHSYFLKYLRAVGVCGKYLTAGCPVLQEWYSFGVRCGRTGRVAPDDMRRNFNIQAALEQNRGAAYQAPVTLASRESFALAFGIDEGAQLELEGVLRSASIDSRVVCKQPTDDTDLSRDFAFLLTNKLQ